MGWHFVISNQMAVQAEALRLAFEATVTEAGDFGESALPFALEPGDILAGELSFDSLEDLRQVFGQGAEVSEGTLRLRFKGLETFHAFNKGLLQPIADINDPPSGPRSGISLGWLPTTDVFPAFSGSYQSNAAISLAGPAGIIGDLDDAVDFEKWNELTESRILSLSFEFPNTVAVEAAIGEIAVVPEPSTCAAALMLFSLLSARAAFVRKSRDFSLSVGTYLAS